MWNPRHEGWYMHLQDTTTMSKQWNISKQTGHGPINSSRISLVCVERCRMGLGVEKVNLSPKPLEA
jgi:hypothetical protein